MQIIPVAVPKNTPLNAGDTIETREGRLQFALLDGGDVCNQNGCLNAVNGQTIAVDGLGAVAKPSNKAEVAAAASPVKTAVTAVAEPAKAVFAANDATNENGFKY